MSATSLLSQLLLSELHFSPSVSVPNVSVVLCLSVFLSVCPFLCHSTLIHRAHLWCFGLVSLRRQRPTLQPYRTEARRRSRRRRNWRKGWRRSQPTTPPPHLLLRHPNPKAAPQRAHPPSLRPRRKRSSSHRRSWKRARSRRRKRRPEAFRHTRPRWNTTVKHFLVYNGVADELTTSDLFKHSQLRCRPQTQCDKLTYKYFTVTLVLTDLTQVVIHLQQVKKHW